MANFGDIMKSLEQKMLGTIAWITTHSGQLSKMQSELEAIRADVADMFKQLTALKEDAQNKGK